ncbi:MAG: GTP-binding protein [Oscillospiraceae bacterium]
MDFSAEMERTLQVLDYAVLVISGTDGVQAHTETLWQLLRRYRVPVFVFVTKMDLPGADRAALMADLRAHLSGACVDFTDPDPEQIALCDEAALEQYLDTGALPDETVRALIRSRKLFPCLFGSGLKLHGRGRLLAALSERYAAPPEYPAGIRRTGVQDHARCAGQSPHVPEGHGRAAACAHAADVFPAERTRPYRRR